MNVNINGRRIEYFRTTISPPIGPMPKNSFSVTEKGHEKWEMAMTPAGIYVKAFYQMPGDRKPDKHEFVVPYANVSVIKFLSEKAVAELEAKEKAELEAKEKAEAEAKKKAA